MEWKEELALYPQVEKKSEESFSPTELEEVDVYCYHELNWMPPAFQNVARQDGPPYEAEVLADLKVFRGPLPDHESALQELRQRAAELGADHLTDVLYTVIVGPEYLGGAELVGWIYEGRAARREEDAR